MFTFADLLVREGLMPETVQLMRHQPTERRLAAALPGLRVARPDLFNAYQEWQRHKLFDPSGIMAVASFIGDRAGRAIFAGLWTFEGRIPASEQEWRDDSRNQELIGLGMDGWGDRPRPDRAIFRMTELDCLAGAVGKLLVAWQQRGQVWSHRADRQSLPVVALHEESRFDPAPQPWDQIDLSWAELAMLPSRRRLQLAEWRGIYLIFDETDGRGYVGSASGDDNILGRWLHYAARSDGGNKMLRGRDSAGFAFRSYSAFRRTCHAMKSNVSRQTGSGGFIRGRTALMPINGGPFARPSTSPN